MQGPTERIQILARVPEAQGEPQQVLKKGQNKPHIQYQIDQPPREKYSKYREKQES
jgi:hypothetical protein